jgi:hypothetical protein
MELETFFKREELALERIRALEVESESESKKRKESERRCRELEGELEGLLGKSFRSVVLFGLSLPNMTTCTSLTHELPNNRSR